MNWVIQCLMLLYFGEVALSTFPIPGLPIAFNPEYIAVGIKNTTRRGTEAHLFLGLPYAKPPVRFEKPQPLSLNPLKVQLAQSWKRACHQVIDVSPTVETSEDCLYLNIFTPAKPSQKLLPVLIFIHGGGYAYGYTQAYGYEYFVDNFVSQDIIMVTLQYRLAHFGFMATRDHVINGNFGHFDQLEALKFIKRNIENFGGDPNRITLSGHSAGSTSTHALSLSSKTRDLYNQEIHIAGSNYALWGIASESTFNHSELISNALNCTQANTTARKVCLQNVNHTKFWEVRKELGLYDFVPDKIDIVYWGSNFDNDFFEGKTLDQLQRKATKRRTLYGVDSGEGLLENRANADANKIRWLLLQLLTDPKFDSPTTKETIINKILTFYNIGTGPNATDPLHYFYKLTELNTDILLITPIAHEIDVKQNLNWPDQYMFQFNYVRPQDRPHLGDIPGHGYFLLYFCGLNIYLNNGISNTTEDNLVQSNLAPIFINFVKGGSPSSNGISIPKITANRTPYMLISTDVKIEDTRVKRKLDFWQGLATEYHYDFLRQVNLQ